MEDHCLVLPDVCADDLVTFLRCLFAADKDDWDGGVIAKLVHVGRTIGVAADGITSYRPESPPPPPDTANATALTNGDHLQMPPPPKPACSRAKHPKRSRVVAGGGGCGNRMVPKDNSSSLYSEELSGLSSLFLDNESTNTAHTNSSSGSNNFPDKKCLLKLAEISIDTVTDDVLTENFCDQDGRLGKAMASQNCLW